MSCNILYTDNFERELRRLIKKYKSLKRDLSTLITSLEQNPKQGVSLGKNCYKIRLAISSKGKGKSGGARIITHFYIDKKIIYLLSIYDKSEKETISDKELKLLLSGLK